MAKKNVTKSNKSGRLQKSQADSKSVGGGATPSPGATSKHDGTNKNAAGLTPMQEKFVHLYCADPKHNATRAAKEAGYAEDSASQQGYQLLQIPSVSKAITERLVEVYNTIDITGERILREIAKIAFGSLKDVAKWNGKEIELLNSDQLDEIGAAMLKSISASESFSESSTDSGSSSSSSRSISFGVFSKEKALELLAKNKNLINERVDHKHSFKLEDLLGASHEEDK